LWECAALATLRAVPATGRQIMLPQIVQQAVRFGPYEADFHRGELRKFGIRLKIQSKPLAVLAILVQTPRQTVLREEFRRALWPDDVFVDFDKNLATAVNKLRQALCDTAESPQYIETVPRVGYRFLVPVEVLSKQSTEEASPAAVEIQRTPDSPAATLPRRKPWTVWIFATAVVFTAVLILLLVASIADRHRSTPVLSAKDTVVVTDFANNTSDPVFDDSLKVALTVALNQSPFLNVLPDSRVAKTLKLMAQPVGAKLTPEVAQQLCHRTGSKAYIAGAIASLGSDYVLGLKAVNCQGGATLDEEQVTVDSKDKVLNALGAMSSKLRSQLGESLATVQRFDAPLAEVTTPSLEALQAYSLGGKADREHGIEAGLLQYQRAIQLDPNFARAYAALGSHYESLSEMGRANEYYTKAFELRDHASEREKLVISGRYYENVTGELAKAARTYQEVVDSYPRDGAVVDLGNVYAAEGEYQKALEVMRQAQQLAPDRLSTYGNLANYLLALQQPDEARQVLQQAQARKLDGFTHHSALYALAFLAADSTEMTKQRQWFNAKSDLEHFGFSLASDTEAYAGHLKKARELTAQSVASAIQADSKENAAIWWENAALREAAFGNLGEARRAAIAGLGLAPSRQDVQVEAAVASAMFGDTAGAQSLAEELSKRYPLDTQLQSLWLPAIQAQVALNRKNSEAAINDLKPALPRIEYGQIGFLANISCLPWTYIRGQAYLASGQATAAAAEFQKILDHSGVVWNCWTGALARLGVARANASLASTSQGADSDAARVRALAAYKDFLSLWENADPDIPVYKQAKAEYAKLQ
jgi:DNA-binding winged helix-turn-helix (wHTH) protein/tetratricopeptide (TPR) repeat protein